MTWTRVDDNLDENDKQLSMTHAEFRLWVNSWTYCARLRTNGRLSTVKAKALARKLSVDGDAINGLVEKGGWDVDGAAGWIVHDFSEYNPSREDVERRRSQAVARGRASADSRRAKYGTAVPVNARNTETTESATESATESPPNPVTRNPSPVVPGTSVVTGTKNLSSRREMTLFTEVWNRNCEPLPRLNKPPESGENVRLVLRAMRYFEGDTEAMGRAIRRAALNEDYRKDRRNFATFCRHVEERWGPEPEARSAPILPMASADDRARRRLAVSNAVREKLQAGVVPRPEDFDPIDRGYLDQALAENREVIWAMRHPELAVAR